MNTEQADVEAVAELIGDRAGFQPNTMVARRILASDWLATYVAARVAEALKGTHYEGVSR